ncbi:PRC-barrel domain-containing protein [Haloarchaeobius sp. DFWS5]|uniref:PRC-barrel domain-containing protein n=1 Tax=Haloarchaeobius sp. DFWS5 TaxID=3446114 RepID=UPI003EBD320C
MNRALRPTDEGKHVFTADGELVGTVSDVRDGRAHVDLNDVVPSSTVRNAVETDDEGLHIILAEQVETIGEGRITLRTLTTDETPRH